MLYEAYREKLAKRARTFERVWRFRLLFAAAFLLLLAGACALMGVAGGVTGETVPDSLVYGQPISASAETVFGRAYGFEYRAAGTGTWSEEEPRAAGEYECRAYGRSILGTKRYGGVHTLTIAPASVSVEVADSALVFGEKPTFTAAQLQYDDTLEVSSYTMEEDSPGNLSVKADEEGIAVYNAEGEDVTSSYTFTAVPRTVTDVRRAVTVETADASFEYDGTSHSSREMFFGGYGLAEGHVFEAVFPALTEAGSCKNLPEEFHIYDEDGEDVTPYYNLTFDAGTLTVTARKLTVSTPSDALTYDGADHTYGEYTLIEGELVAGDEIVLSDLLTARNAGSYKNAPHVAIFADGVEKTHNYDIEMQCGAVEIARRKLTVTTSSPAFVYDGAAHSFDDCTSSEAAPSHTVEFSGYASATDAGEYANTVSASVLDGDGQDVTRNYEIEERFGTIAVQLRPLSLRTRTETFVYDGTAHTFGGETVEIFGGTSLADGQELALSGTFSFTEAGEHRNSPQISVFSSGRNVTRNYEITAEYGAITVQKRAVKVETASHTFVYDGLEHTYPEFSELPAGEGRYEHAEGHSLVSSAVAKLTACGSIPNELSFTVRDGRGRDVTSNYTVTAETLGTLAVTQRELTLRAGSGTFEYDAQPHSVPAWTEESGTLAAGHRAEGTFSSWTDAATYENTPADPHILDRSGADVTSNYAVRWESGTVTIETRKVTLLTDSETWTYDAQPHFKRSYRAVVNTLVSGHTAETDYSSRTNAGEEENAVSGETHIFDGAHNDVTKNYEITWRHGTLTILQRPLTVTTAGHSWMYDAASHSENAYTVQNLVEGHLFAGTVVSLPEIEERGTKKNDFTFSSFTVTAGEEDVTENYKIGAWIYGDLVITPRPLTVLTMSETRIYDGEARSYKEWWADYSDAEKLEGHEVSVQFIAPASADVGQYRNTCTAAVTANGRDVTHNYEITYNYGTLTVNRRPVLVQTGDETFLYDDVWHTNQTYTVLGEEATYYPLVAGHTLNVTNSTRIRDVGTLPNEFTAGVLGEGRDLSHNYDIQYRRGTLEVTPLAVSLLSGSDSFEYDAQPHSVPTYTEKAEKLVEGHRIEADYPSRTVAGDTENRPVNVLVLRADGSTVEAKNYVLTWEYGTVTVTKREVTLRTDSGKWTYDAQPHAQPSYTEAKNTLVSGHTAETGYSFRRDAGEEANAVSGGTFVFDERHNDVTENYTITWEYGTLTIDARPVVVLSNSHEWVYDGKYHTEEGFTCHAPEGREDGGLVSGHRFVPSKIVPTQVKNVTTGTENVHEYTFEITDGEGNPVTKNYEVTYEYGILKITERPITVTTDSGEWVYDGEYHFKETCTYGAPADGHTVQSYSPVPDTALRVIDVGEPRPNMLQVTLVILDEEGEDVAANYTIAYTYGKLQITPRPITVKSGDGSIIYDAAPHTFEEGWEAVYPEGYPALEGHEIRPLFNSYTKAMTYQNGFTARIFDEGREVTGNFTISYEYGRAVILSRKITITTGNGEWVYDGSEHSTADFTYEKAEGDRGLAPGDEIRSVTGTTVIKITDTDDEVGYVPNFGLSAIFRDKNNTIINECYEIEWVSGKLRVKTPITIRLFSLTKQYDGEPLAYGEDDYFVMKKPPDVEESWIKVKLGGSITAPGGVTLEELRELCSGTVVNGEEDYTLQNGFVFEGAEEPLKVTRRVIRITTLSITRERGEAPLYGDDTDGEAYWLSVGSLLSGHRLECDVTGVLMPEENSAVNGLANIRIYDGAGRDVTDYYEIDTQYGTLAWLTDEEPPVPAT